MENKYYTPDISEFHVGFEYERMNGADWEKAELTNVDCWGTMSRGYEKKIEEIDSLIRSVRVKYLDREDIESLGFKDDQEYKSTVDESNSDWHYDYGMESNNKKLKLIYINWRTYGAREIEEVDHSKYNEYSVVKIVKSVIPGEEFTAFLGFIKNKSELKRILKMIGYGI